MDPCQGVIQGRGTNHERYLRLFRVLQDGDDDVAWAFNDLRRSTANNRLAAMVKLGLVTDDELGRFSEATRETTQLMLRLTR
jgi:hypothetical protein